MTDEKGEKRVGGYDDDELKKITIAFEAIEIMNNQGLGKMRPNTLAKLADERVQKSLENIAKDTLGDSSKDKGRPR